MKSWIIRHELRGRTLGVGFSLDKVITLQRPVIKNKFTSRNFNVLIVLLFYKFKTPNYGRI